MTDTQQTQAELRTDLPAVEIDRVEERAELYSIDSYRASTGTPEAVRLCLDPESEPARLYCETYSPGQGTPIRMWNGRVRTWEIPALTDAAANTLMEEIAPLAARVVEGYESRWDGSNNVGELDTDAMEAESAIESLCSEHRFDPTDLCHVWAAGDWLLDTSDAELRLTASTTDEQLAKIIASVENGPNVMPGECDRVDGVDDYLRKRREALREDKVAVKASELATAHWTERAEDRGQNDRTEYSYSPGCWTVWRRVTWADRAVTLSEADCPEGDDEQEPACEAAQRVEHDEWTEAYVVAE